MSIEAVSVAPRRKLLSPDQRAELWLGALVVGVVGLLIAMMAFILAEAWPSFSHNGLAWFGSGGNVDDQLGRILSEGANNHQVFTVRMWPLIYSTVLTTGLAVVIAFVLSLFVAVFMVEFAPEVLKRTLEPVIRLLASVPSVIYGLVAVLTLVPFQQPSDQRVGEGFRYAGHHAHRLQPARRGDRADGDDLAGDDRDLRRGSAYRPARLA